MEAQRTWQQPFQQRHQAEATQRWIQGVEYCWRQRKQMEGVRVRAVRDYGNGEKKEENKSMRQCVIICGLLVPVG